MGLWNGSNDVRNDVVSHVRNDNNARKSNYKLARVLYYTIQYIIHWLEWRKKFPHFESVYLGFFLS